MFRDSPSIRNQVNLAAFDQPSDLCYTELVGFLRVWVGSRRGPHFVILAITVCVLGGSYVRLDLLPQDIRAGLPLAHVSELDQLPEAHFAL
jgi:hypothetical protein